MLYICATPIGNLEDITFRVARILSEVDLIAAEDTRHTARLLAHLKIKTRMISYHEHNKKANGEKIASLLASGHDVALVTDAGLPCISDPGEDLVKLCIERKLPLTVLPGPTALTTALAHSGLPTTHFLYEGFLPSRQTARKKRLCEIKDLPYTLIMYEAPHRLTKTLADLIEVLGPRNCAIARELTKKFEEVLRLPLPDALAYFQETPPKGEFVIVIDGQTVQAEKPKNIDVKKEVETLIEKGFDKKDAIREVAQTAGLTRREVYNCFCAHK